MGQCANLPKSRLAFPEKKSIKFHDLTNEISLIVKIARAR